jgi:5-methylcytosine-specific restriction endonuclease McrA
MRCGEVDGLEVHHLVAVGDGGSHELSNLITLCARCHRNEHRPAA